jgi:hypothetical protein
MNKTEIRKRLNEIDNESRELISLHNSGNLSGDELEDLLEALGDEQSELEYELDSDFISKAAEFFRQRIAMRTAIQPEVYRQVAISDPAYKDRELISFMYTQIKDNYYVEVKDHPIDGDILAFPDGTIALVVDGCPRVLSDEDKYYDEDCI